MTVIREYTINEFALKDQFITGQETVQASQSLPSNMLLQGATMRTSTGYGRTATVKAGEDIRPALESLKSAGGGTLILLAGVHRPEYNIIGASKINIVGEGIDQTVIDFGGGAYELRYGASTGGYSNFKLADFTVRNASAIGFVIEDCTDFQVSDIKTEDHGSTGFYILNSYRFVCARVAAESNTFTGIKMEATDTNCHSFDFQFCTASLNGSYGIHLSSGTTGFLHSFTIIGCRGESNGNSNLRIFSGGSGTTQTYNYVVNGFHSSTPPDIDYGIDVDGLRYTVIGCTQDVGLLFIKCTTDGFTGPAAVIGCTGVGSYSIDDNVSSVGNTVEIADTIHPFEMFASNADRDAVVLGTTGGSPMTEKSIHHMYNGHGSTISSGRVVVLRPSTHNDEVIMSTTLGDDRVFGMAMEAINSGERGRILVEGYTTILEVNGVTDIAKGDFLTCYTSTGKACKASAGDMAFAIALEAYTADNSSGVIDAFIIKPRKI